MDLQGLLTDTLGSIASSASPIPAQMMDYQHRNSLGKIRNLIHNDERPRSVPLVILRYQKPKIYLRSSVVSVFIE